MGLNSKDFPDDYYSLLYHVISYLINHNRIYFLAEQFCDVQQVHKRLRKLSILQASQSPKHQPTKK